MYVSKTTIGLKHGVVTLPRFYSDSDLTLTPLSQIAVNMQYFLIQHTQCILCPKAYKSMFLADDDLLVDFFLDAYAYFEQNGNEELILMRGILDLDVVNIEEVPTKHEQLIKFYEITDFRDYPSRVMYDNVDCKVLYYVDEDDFVELCFTEFLKKPYAFSDQDKAILGWFKKQEKEMNLYYPKTEAMIANLRFIADMFDVTVEDELDVLRIAIAFSNGDPARLTIPPLKKNLTPEEKKNLKQQRLRFKFKLTSAHKTRVLMFFEQLEDFKEAYKRKYQNRFIRLGEQLGIHKNRAIYPNTWKNYCRLRNKGLYLSEAQVIDRMYSKII